MMSRWTENPPIEMEVCRYKTRLRGLDVKSTQVDFVITNGAS
jgi:hypothetical protein